MNIKFNGYNWCCPNWVSHCPLLSRINLKPLRTRCSLLSAGLAKQIRQMFRSQDKTPVLSVTVRTSPAITALTEMSSMTSKPGREVLISLHWRILKISLGENRATSPLAECVQNENELLKSLWNFFSKKLLINRKFSKVFWRKFDNNNF